MPSLASVFLFLAVLGGIGVLLQGVGALVGLGGDHEIGGHVVDHDVHLDHRFHPPQSSALPSFLCGGSDSPP